MSHRSEPFVFTQADAATVLRDVSTNVVFMQIKETASAAATGVLQNGKTSPEGVTTYTDLFDIKLASGEIVNILLPECGLHFDKLKMKAAPTGSFSLRLWVT